MARPLCLAFVGSRLRQLALGSVREIAWSGDRNITFDGNANVYEIYGSAGEKGSSIGSSALDQSTSRACGQDTSRRRAVRRFATAIADQSEFRIRSWHAD